MAYYSGGTNSIPLNTHPTALGTPIPLGMPVYGWTPTFGAVAPAPLPAPTIRKRKALKRGIPEPVQVQFNPYTGQPNLPDGVHEVYRAKLMNPMGSHYGVIVVRYGQAWAYDLQNDVGPRKISAVALAAGRALFVTKSVPPGPEMVKALERLNEAWRDYSKWMLWENNCEHWAKYVVRGERKSDQINGVKLIGGILLGAIFVGAAAGAA